MTFSLLTQAAIAVIGLVAAILTVIDLRSTRRARVAEARAVVELLRALPPQSPARTSIEAAAQAHALRLMAVSQRSPGRSGLSLAVVFTLVSTLSAVAAVNAGGWWLATLPVAFVGLALGAFGLGRDGPARERERRREPPR